MQEEDDHKGGRVERTGERKVEKIVKDKEQEESNQRGG